MKVNGKEIDINNIEIGYSKDSKIIYRKDNIKQAITIESETMDYSSMLSEMNGMNNENLIAILCSRPLHPWSIY